MPKSNEWGAEARDAAVMAALLDRSRILLAHVARGRLLGRVEH